jgi:NAD(P)-dependent dehydrogenase (short-subunit alcohol dehydrogenase family)
MQRASEMFGLDGRVAVVTGAGSGLGREFASVLAGNGARVACLDIEREWLDETVAVVEEAGGETVGMMCDISDAASAGQAVAKVLEQMGRIDILVNNAGITAPARRTHEIAIEDWDQVLAVNLRGTFLCTRAVLPTMLDQQHGSIINLASVCGWGGVAPGIAALAHYAASKGGVIGFTKQVAIEYAQDGIRANAIAPGWHLGTRLGRNTGFDDKSREAAVETIVAMTPMARTGEPAELQGLLLYLASDASSFMTGQVIAHDGGWTAW